MVVELYCSGRPVKDLNSEYDAPKIHLKQSKR